MKPKSFVIQELVDPDTYKMRGERAWELLDAGALVTLQKLRDTFGALKVNDWHTGGNYRESGLRSATTSTGAKYSQHKFGRAFDCKFAGFTPTQVRDYVLAHRNDFPYITVIEDTAFTPTWFHFDTRFTNRSDIWLVKP
jgi:hypothetical protein